MKDILLKGIVVKNCRKTEDESFREVEKKDGTLFVGIFENGVGYLKYWKDKAQSRDQARRQGVALTASTESPALFRSAGRASSLWAW